MYRPSSSDARMRRVINPVVFERLAAGLSSVEQKREKQQRPRPSRTQAKRKQKQRRPAWIAAGSAATAESEAVHLAHVLNDSADTSDSRPPAERQRYCSCPS
jgi:hypothetical protein